MNRARPIFLNLWQLRFPPMAIVSILHRISGIIIFLFIPFLLYLLHQSLMSNDGFNNVALFTQHVYAKFLLWVVLSATLFHFIAGLRHIIMDLGFAESLNAGRATAVMVFILSALLIIAAGVWLCMR